MSALSVKNGLTPQQIEFVQATIRHGNLTQAAREAGYSGAGAGPRLARIPHVAAAIHFEIERQLVAEAAPLAFRVACDLLREPKTSERIKADLSIKILTMAGHGAKEGKNDSQDKAISEMSSAELHAYLERNQAEIERLETELAARAKEVITPSGGSDEAKPLNYLD